MPVPLTSHCKPRQHFPDHPQFSCFMKPCRVEGEVLNLEVHGEIPSDIDGTFYRVMPDPQLPPFIENDPWFNGDDNISAFKIKDGQVSFQQRYVRTEKFTRERDARRALIGKYRNKFTDAVEFKVRSTANTNVVYFNDNLLALKEDSPPYALDPHTLETRGEMICFGYEAKTPDVCYYRIARDGKFLEVVWLCAPVVAMIHDFAVTANWVLFPLIPQLCDIDRLKHRGEHWEWSNNTPFYIGVLPRQGAKPTDVKWFRYQNSFPGHTANAYEDSSGKVVLDLGLSDKNVFFWWPDAQGNSPEPSSIHSQLTRFVIDPSSSSLDLPHPEVLQKDNSEFYRIDGRFTTQNYRHCFSDLMDPACSWDRLSCHRSSAWGKNPYGTGARVYPKTCILRGRRWIYPGIGQ